MKKFVVMAAWYERGHESEQVLRQEPLGVVEAASIETAAVALDVDLDKKSWFSYGDRDLIGRGIRLIGRAIRLHERANVHEKLLVCDKVLLRIIEVPTLQNGKDLDVELLEEAIVIPL